MICGECRREVAGTLARCPFCGADLYPEVWREPRRSGQRPSLLALGFSCLLLILLIAAGSGAVAVIALYFIDWWLPSYPDYLPTLLGSLSLTIGFFLGLVLAVRRFLHARPRRSRARRAP